MTPREARDRLQDIDARRDDLRRSPKWQTYIARIRAQYGPRKPRADDRRKEALVARLRETANA